MAQPTIVVTDNANGTGAQVAVSGTAGGTNTVNIALTDRVQTIGYTTTTFTRTGDGPIQIPVGSSEDSSTVPTGVNLTHAWFVTVTNSVSGLTSLPGCVTPTYGLLTPHFQAICALQRMIIGENIGRIAGKVYRCEDVQPFLANIQNYPAVVLSAPEPQQYQTTSNLGNLWKFPIMCEIIDNDATWYKQLEWHLWTNWTILGFAARVPLEFGNGQPGKIRRMDPAPRTLIGPADENYQYQRSSFILNCECDRGVGSPG